MKSSTEFPTVAALPKIAIERRGGKDVYTDGSDTWRGSLGYFIGLPIVLAAAGGSSYAWYETGEWGLGLVAVIFSFAFFAVLVATIRQVIVLSALKPGILEVDAPLYPGASREFIFSRTGKNQLSVPRVKASLQCVENVQWQCGTDTCSASRTLWNVDLPEYIPQGLRWEITAVWNVEIPAHLPSSFQARRNQIEWKFTAHMEIEGLPDDDSLFSLLVLPYEPSEAAS